MDVKGKVLLQLFNKSKSRNGTETFLEPKFSSIVKFKKLGFSAPLNPLLLKYQYSEKFYWWNEPCKLEFYRFKFFEAIYLPNYLGQGSDAERKAGKQ